MRPGAFCTVHLKPVNTSWRYRACSLEYRPRINPAAERGRRQCIIRPDFTELDPLCVVCIRPALGTHT